MYFKLEKGSNPAIGLLSVLAHMAKISERIRAHVIEIGGSGKYVDGNMTYACGYLAAIELSGQIDKTKWVRFRGAPDWHQLYRPRATKNKELLALFSSADEPVSFETLCAPIGLKPTFAGVKFYRSPGIIPVRDWVLINVDHDWLQVCKVDVASYGMVEITESEFRHLSETENPF